MSISPETSQKASRLNKSVILIGFMGVGKSTVGHRLASRLGRPFVETDQLIVDQARQTIPEIFASKGESGFRDMESQVCQSLLTRSPSVISTGGGIVGRDENRELLKNLGVVVWLDAPFEAIWERISTDINRPLAAGQTQESIRQLYDRRVDWYNEISHLRIDTSQTTPEASVDRILGYLYTT